MRNHGAAGRNGRTRDPSGWGRSRDAGLRVCIALPAVVSSNLYYGHRKTQSCINQRRIEIGRGSFD